MTASSLSLSMMMMMLMGGSFSSAVVVAVVTLSFWSVVVEVSGEVGDMCVAVDNPVVVVEKMMEGALEKASKRYPDFVRKSNTSKS